MGFKYSELVFTGQSSDFPSGTSNALIRQREEFIVKGIAQALIDADTGWTLDTPKNATITAFVDIPTKSSSIKSPGLYLKNNTSGCKLFVSYNGRSPSGGIAAAEGCSITAYNSEQNTEEIGLNGLILSIIPESSTDDFTAPLSTDATLSVPSSATRLACTATNYSTYSSYTGTISQVNISGVVYRYGVLSTASCVVILIQKNLKLAVGRVLGELAHTDDSEVSAKYGVIYFDRCYDIREDRRNANSSIVPAGGVNYASYGQNPDSLAKYNANASTSQTPYWGGMSSVSKSDGTWVGNTSDTVVSYFPANSSFYRNTYISYSTANNTKRWMPFICYIQTGDLQTNGVVPGDGIKGLLDTDLFRYVPSEANTLLDDGAFYVLDSMLTIGWSGGSNLPPQ